MAIREGSFFDHDVRLSFEEEWPELARRLERLLAAKGVDRWLRADVIQETATRLYPRWETFDHSVPLWNLVATIALRVVHNHRRKESRIELVPDPTPLHRDDVPERGLQRAQLDKTRAALRHLTADQRSVLLAEVGEAVLPGGTRNRTNVLRLRARAKLREALGPWAPSGVVIKLRELGVRIAQRRSVLEMHVPAMANSIVTIATVATLGMAGAAGSAVATAGTPQSGPARLLSLVKSVDAGLDPLTKIRRLESLDLTRAKDRAKKMSDEASAAASDPGAFVEKHREFVEDKQEWAERTKQWQENHNKEFVQGKQEWAERTKQWQENHNKEFVQGKHEWAERTKQWAEDKLS